jgi:hypothetical protein
MTASFRDTASFGKRQEFRVIAELLSRGFDVYIPLVDDIGIDCVLKIKDDRYIDVQIKARSSKAKTQYRFPGLKINAKPNYYFIFYFESRNEYWTIPTLELVNLCYCNKDKYDFAIPKKIDEQKRPELLRYINEKGFELLRSTG